MKDIGGEDHGTILRHVSKNAVCVDHEVRIANERQLLMEIQTREHRLCQLLARHPANLLIDRSIDRLAGRQGL